MSIDQLDIFTVFEGFATSLAKDSECRVSVRKHTTEIETTVRHMQATLQTVHSPDAPITAICDKTLSFLPKIVTEFALVTEQLDSEGEFYRYRDTWMHSLTKLTYILAMVYFLQHNKLISREEVAEQLGLLSLKRPEGSSSRTSRGAKLSLEIQDYLTGLCMLPAELSRLCVNCATCGNYIMAQRISSFVNDLYSGFQMLNLKNDGLRKKYDSIKYDLRRIEGVIYDLSVRGLISPRTKNVEEKESESMRS